MITYHVDFSLCRLAAMAVSKHLWRHSHLKNVLESFLETGVTRRDETVPRAITSVMNQLILPEPAKEELMLAIATMGWQMCDVFSELEWIYPDVIGDVSRQKHAQISSYMDRIHWRNDRCLHLADIMRALYYSKCFSENYTTWVELSRYCLEDCMNDLWPKLSEMEQSVSWRDLHDIIHDLGFDKKHECDYILQIYWVARMKNELPNATGASFRVWNASYYDGVSSLSEVIIVNSFVSGNYQALQYFWKLLDDKQRVRTITNIGHIINHEYSHGANTFLLKEKRGGNYFLSFLFQQLSFYHLDDVRIGLLRWGFVLRQMLNWPHDNRFLALLRESLLYHDSIDYGPIFVGIFNNIDDLHQFIQYDVKYHRIFCEIWTMNPKNLKKSINDAEALGLLEKLKNVRLYNYILEDEELKGMRKTLLNKIMDGWRSIDSHFEEEFIAKVLVSQEEREWFKYQISWLPGTRRRLE
ncbi:uncharacterized protein LOC107046758 [Diachasma alloeum]|uniref:uncharacterized protein LOC107046758 n=1 Tax=Diachasma alloeum TaxID=454923 RepID=UPI00073822E6|nr:uncharacterized protein LOC107046758 [Diachasma alloeum]